MRKERVKKKTDFPHLEFALTEAEAWQHRLADFDRYAENGTKVEGRAEMLEGGTIVAEPDPVEDEPTLDQLLSPAPCNETKEKPRPTSDKPTTSDFMVPLPVYLSRKREVPPQIIDDFGWGPGGAMLAAAMGGLGKTLFIQSMAIDLATGSPVLGRFPATKGENVGLFIMEDPDGETAKRMTSILDDRDAEDARLWVFDREREHLTLGDKWGSPNERGFSLLDQAIGDLHLSVVLFDPLVNLHDADENSNTEMLRWLKPLRELCRRHGTSVAISHHTTWGQTGHQHERGASAIRNWADTVLHLRNVQGEKGRTEHRRLSVAKMNFGRPFEPLILTIDSRTLRVTLDTEGATLCTVEDMLHLIRKDMGGSWEGTLTDFYEKAASYFGASDRTIRTAFAGLKKKEGVIVEDLGRGKGFRVHEVAT